MYWLIRSASCPPVKVVSPRTSSGLSLWRFSAPASRWPEWTGWRSSSSLITRKTRTCCSSRHQRRRDCRRQGAGGNPAAGSGSGARVVLLAPGLLLLDVLVVLRELVDCRDAADLQLDAGSQRALLGPLGGLFLAGHLEHPEPVEQFLGLGVRAVGDHRRVGVEVDDEAAVLRRCQALTGEHDARLDQLLVVTAHRVDDLLDG